MNIHVRDSVYSATNVSLKMMLSYAYNVRRDLISGVPGPIDSAHWDIEAKIVEPDEASIKELNGAQRRALMLPVLADRFELKAHIEEKTLPVYELVLMPGGPKFQAVANPSTSDGSTHVDNTTMTAKGVSMESLADTLSGQVHRTVIDKTGLAGKFELMLKWAPEDSAEAQGDTPSIFTALQEQLGLKLVAAKGPVKTLVVDHAAMPTAN